MPKSTMTYWNPLNPDNRGEWRPIEGLEDMAEELTLSMGHELGEYTRLTRFLAGADTIPFGGKSHTYPEEIFIVSYMIVLLRCGSKLGTSEQTTGQSSRPFHNRNWLCSA